MSSIRDVAAGSCQSRQRVQVVVDQAVDDADGVEASPLSLSGPIAEARHVGVGYGGRKSDAKSHGAKRRAFAAVGLEGIRRLARRRRTSGSAASARYRAFDHSAL
jgi:hypothetical protein